MRIISGDYGGRNLKTLSGKTTRPTGDKVRAAIFSMIGPFFDGGQVLDLYAGSGGLAIEAVSRGMDKAVLVERNFQAQAVVLNNINMTKEVDKFILLKMDAHRALQKITESFDLVFLDPPYAQKSIIEDIENLVNLNLLAKDATIVCETETSVSLPDKISDFEMIKEKVYGISKVTIYERGYERGFDE